MSDLDSWLLIPILALAGIFLSLILFRMISQVSTPASAAKSVLTARGYLLLGRIKDAFEESRHAIELDSENAEAHSVLAHLLIEKSEIEQAACEIKQSVQLEPENDSYWRDLGMILLLLSIQKSHNSLPDESLFEESALAFRQSYRLVPQDPYNRLNIHMVEEAMELIPNSRVQDKFEGWPTPILQFYRKEISELECFEEFEKQAQPRSFSEAHFHVALYYLAKADLAAAKRNFRLSYWHSSNYDALCRVFLRLLRD